MFALPVPPGPGPGPCASGDGLDASRAPLGPGAWRRGRAARRQSLGGCRAGGTLRGFGVVSQASPLVDPEPVANPHARAVPKVPWWIQGRWSLVVCPALPATGP